jgi:hypothetical protein
MIDLAVEIAHAGAFTTHHKYPPNAGLIEITPLDLGLGDFAFANGRIKLSHTFLCCRWNKLGNHRFKELQLHAMCDS